MKGFWRRTVTLTYGEVLVFLIVSTIGGIIYQTIKELFL